MLFKSQHNLLQLFLTLNWERNTHKETKSTLTTPLSKVRKLLGCLPN